MAALLGWRVFCLDRGLDRLPVKAVIPNWGDALGEASGEREHVPGGYWKDLLHLHIINVDCCI